MNYSKIPFSYHWILRKAIGSGQNTILDIGCGDGKLMGFLTEGKEWEIHGLELYDKAVTKAKKSGIYESVKKSDVTNVPKVDKFEKYDVVFASQIIEHLNKNNALSTLKEWEKLAKKRVVITTTVGYMEYDLLERIDDANPYQKHLSGWNIRELREIGYKVVGQGARFIYGPNGIARKYPKYLPLLKIFAYILSPIVYKYPNLGTYMIAVKEK